MDSRAAYAARVADGKVEAKGHRKAETKDVQLVNTKRINLVSNLLSGEKQKGTQSQNLRKWALERRRGREEFEKCGKTKQMS